MLKRTLISLLAVLLIMAATTSVFAFNYPTNNVPATSQTALQITFTPNYIDIVSESIAQMSFFSSGNAVLLGLGFINNGAEISLSNFSVDYFHVSFSISVTCDLYIVSPVDTVEVSSSTALVSPGLASHWDPTGTILYDASLNGQLPYHSYAIDVGANTYVFSSNPSWYKNINCYFLKFNDVPAGDYTYYYPPSSFDIQRETFDTADDQFFTAFTYVPFGFYLAEAQTPGGGGGSDGDDSSDDSSSGGDTSSGGGGSGGGIDDTYLDSWTDPDASLSENIANIQSTLNEAVAGSDEPDVQTFYAIYANYQLELLQKENDLNFTNTVNNVESGFSQVINDYIAGNITYADALDDLSDSYVDSLADCETPEQGSYLTAVYQAKQTQLHYKAVDLAGDVIKDVITDEELDNADDYYEAEEALISQFKLQNLQDTVKFQEWYNLLGSAEALTYKSIFDWFLNTSSFKYWLIIPLSMIVITNLLGTVLYVSRHRAYNSRYSDRGSKND